MGYSSLFIIFTLVVTFKMGVEVLNVISKRHSTKFAQLSVLRFVIFIAVFTLVFYPNMTLDFIFSWLLFGYFLGAFYFQRETKIKTWIKKGFQYFAMCVLITALFLGVLWVNVGFDSIWYFIGLYGGVIGILFLVYFGFIHYIIPRFFDLVPYYRGFDCESDGGAYHQFKESVYMVKGKKIRLPMNALFMGIFKRERIMVSDKMLSRLNTQQVQSIIFHEIGHYMYKHLVYRLGFMFVSVFVYTLVIYIGFNQAVFVERILVIVMGGYSASVLIELLFYRLAQFQEFQADSFVVKNGHGEALSEALAIVNHYQPVDHYHPLYQYLFYSHPQLKRRLKRIADEIKS